MYEKKYLVTKVIGNKETILKEFSADEREEAHAFGKEAAQTRQADTVITCYGAMTDEVNHIQAGRREIVEIWG